jgi:hypothetical protein
MAEIDTSSYPKPQAPTNLIDQVQKLGGLQQQKQQIESNALSIDKQKLDLVNQRFGEMSKGFTALIADPSVDEDKIRKYVQNQVKLGYVPPEMAAQTLSTLPPTQGMLPAQASKVLKQSLEQHLQHAQSTMEAINTHFGTPAEQSDSANTYAGVRQSPIKGGGFTPASVTPQQLPPTAGTVDTNPTSANYGQPGYVGPSGAPGPRSYVARPAPPEGMVNNPSQGNLTGNAMPSGKPVPATTGPTGPTVDRGTEFNNRFSAVNDKRGFTPTGLAPGSAEAIQTVGGQSGKDYASALTRAKSFKADLYPAQSALEGIKELGPQGVGPGTESLNNLKSAIITWLPNADPKLVEGVGNFEQTRKYLTQIARSSGTTGTNDQLAAAFEANPSIKLSQAATTNVLKSVISLRKMEHAQTLLFNKTGLPPDQYSKWIATNQNVLDARAFGFDMMDKDAKSKLIGELKKDPKTLKRFEDSLQFAHDAELIEPPQVKR